MRKYWAFVILFVFLLSATANAQKNYPTKLQQYLFCPQHQDALYCFLPIFGLHDYLNADFEPASFQSNLILRINSLFGIETSTLALPSPAVGISLTFDPTLGTFLPSSESLGPILSDRPETIGAHRLNLAFTYQHFGFEELDGQPLQSVGYFNAQKILGGIFANSVALRVDEFTSFITYGLTKRIDVSVAFPVRTVHISGAGVKLAATGVLTPCGEFININGLSLKNISALLNLAPTCFQENIESRASSGLSDITFRGKATLLQSEHGGLAVGLDVRTPTGEPLNFLGSGAFGARPFLIGTLAKRFHRLYLAPHFNVGYQWNGSSLLGGVLLGEEGRLPHVFSYALGTELGVNKRTTMTLDLTGERLFSADRAYEFYSNSSSVEVTAHSINTKDGNVGAKVNPWRTLILSGNLGVRLDRSGLRARLIPLGGVSYVF